MKLSIIIPTYNDGAYIDELIQRLFQQTTKEVEIIVVDDGSKKPYVSPYKGIKVIRQENKGVSAARNAGLDAARGEWVAFIDADDLVSDDYISRIMEELENNPDYIYLSWETFGGVWDYKVILQSVDDKFPPFNLCCWNRVYRRSMIGDVRFNERKQIAEDAQFIADVSEIGQKKGFIGGKSVYFYRTTHRSSLTERFNNGEIDMDRIIYHITEPPKDPKRLAEQIKAEIRDAEVIVMTHLSIPELDGLCMVIPPQPLAGTELRGTYTPLFRQIVKPAKAQIVIYQGRIHEVGGVETWMYNFVKTFKDSYDIIVLYRDAESSKDQIARLSKMVPVVFVGNQFILCDTLLNMRITDPIPSKIKPKRIIQLCHLCQMRENYKIQPQHDLVVFPSEAARLSFKDQVDGVVIQNQTLSEKVKKTLILVTASRFTYEKGEKRMRLLAERLTEAGVPFVWWVFSDKTIKPIPGVVQMGTSFDIKPYIAAADYLVQLSDRESFCYSLVEALELGTAVICTPLEILPEIGVKDGENGYVIPFSGELSDDLIGKISTKIPRFRYNRKEKNKEIEARWREILGDTKPQWKHLDGMTTIEIMRPYFDTVLKRMVQPGEKLTMEPHRAEKIIFTGYAKVATNANFNVL